MKVFKYYPGTYETDEMEKSSISHGDKDGETYITLYTHGDVYIVLGKEDVEFIQELWKSAPQTELNFDTSQVKKQLLQEEIEDAERAAGWDPSP